MKTGKLIAIILVIILIVSVIAYMINNSNKKATASAMTTAPKPNANTVGARVAAASASNLELTTLVNGKPKYLWQGAGPCPNGYNPSSSHPGFCELTASIAS